MKRILFVDDEYSTLDSIRRTLEAERGDWEMRFAQSGGSALAECDGSRFDVVVTDMRMPGMDGVTLLNEIRNRLPDAARIILSDHSDFSLATRSASVAHRVLTKGCSPRELMMTIEQILTLQDIFCTPEIRKIIGKIGTLPSLSTTYAELTKAVQDPESTVISVARIIQKDVAMTAKVLQLVNSGFFGLARTITGVHTAVGYLGIETVKNLALASETFSIFKPGPDIPKTFYEAVQRQAERTAVIAGSFSLSQKDRDVAVVSALLHDVGSLVLANKMPHMLVTALAMVKERGCEQFEAEESLMGVSHAELGAYLLGVWGIGGPILEAVAHHHRPDRIPHAGLDSAVVVYLAALLAEELEVHPRDLHGEQLKKRDRQCLEELGLAKQYPTFREQALLALNQRRGQSAA
jgi:HD-like signal output (HDOD) protein